MPSLEKFSSIWGTNWVTGRYLLPILEEWGSEQHGVVLDLGCGDSPFRGYFPQAQQYLPMDRFPNVEARAVTDIRSIPILAGSIDTALLFQVLADIPEPDECLSEIARTLKVGGNLIVFESMCYQEHDLPDDYFRIMPGGLKHLAEKTGFQTEVLIRLGGLFTRIAIHWNTCIMGKLQTYTLLRPAGSLGIALCNLLCYVLDRAFPHPLLASDYIARLVKVPMNRSQAPKSLHPDIHS